MPPSSPTARPSSATRKLPAALAARGAYYLDNLADELGPLAAGTALVPPTLPWSSGSIDLGGRNLAPRGPADRAYRQRPLGARRGDRHALARGPAVHGARPGDRRQPARLARGAGDAARAGAAARVVPGHGPASAPWPAAAPLERYLDPAARRAPRPDRGGGTLEQAVASVGRASARAGGCSTSTTRATSPRPSPSWSGNEAQQRRGWPRPLGSL